MTRSLRKTAARAWLASLVGLASLLGCGAKPAPGTAPPGARVVEPASSVAFDYVGQSWMRVPARVADGPPTKMMLDTGMGVTLLTPEACARARCVREGTWSGQRMSGQRVELTLARVASLTVAGHRVEQAQVAVFESDEIIHRDLGVDGIAGLDLFRDRPVTFDHRAGRVVLETPGSLAARAAAGATVKVRVKHDGPSTEVYLPLEIAPGVVAEMEVDSGSLHLILDERYLRPLGVAPDAPDVVVKEGKDETGAPFVRRYAPSPRALSVVGARDVVVPAGAKIMFQRIVHDGLVGQELLREHVVTFDLARGEMIFAR